MAWSTEWCLEYFTNSRQKNCLERVRKVLFCKFSSCSCIKLAMDFGWWSRGMWRDVVEFPFFSSEYWSFVWGRQYTWLGQLNVIEGLPILCFEWWCGMPLKALGFYIDVSEKIAGLEAIQKEFQKFQAINFIFSATWTCVPSTITLICCWKNFFFKNFYSSVLHFDIFATFIVLG